MRAYKIRSERLDFIDERIRRGMKRGRYYSSRQLAEEWKEKNGFEVFSEKTIQRDLVYLRNNRKAPLAYDDQRHGWYYTEKNYFLPAIMLKQSEMFAIYITEKVLEQYMGTPIYQDLQSIFTKIQGSLPDNVTIHTPAFSRFSLISPPTIRIDLDTWKTVFIALEKGKKIRMEYRTPGSTIENNSWRNVSPYHVVNYSGAWYLIGYCHLRLAIRTFNISRIKHIEILGDDADNIPENFSVKDTLQSAFGMHLGEFGKNKQKVVLRFEKEVASHVEERKWHPTQSIEYADNGAILFSAEIDGFTELIYWILSWGIYVTVVAPDELRVIVKDQAQRIASRYQ
jgi:predicted DNA-binding transcriptional regulator YafY